DAYQAYFDGEELLNRLDMKGAEEQFTRAVAIDSTFALAHFRIAYLAWWSQQALETAKKHVALAMENLDRMPDRERYLVRSLNDGVENGFEAQESALREMQEHYPNDKEMLFGIGDVQFHDGATDTATAYFERVVAIDPAFDRALQHLTWAYLEGSRYTEAAQVAKKWVDRANTAEAHRNLGTALFKLGERDHAMEALAVSNEMEPENPDTARRLAEIYLADGDMEKTLGNLEPLMAEGRSFRARITGGQLLSRCVYPYQGRYRDALAIIDQGIEMYASEKGDSSMLAQMYLGRATLEYWGWRDRDKLLAAAEATREMPGHGKRDGYWQDLAIIYYVLGDTASASAIVAEHCDKTNERTVLETRLVELAMTGRCDEARILMESTPSFEKLMGRSAVTRNQFFIGWCQVKQEDFDGAIKSFEAVIQTTVDYQTAAIFSLAHYLLGKSYEAVGRSGDATDTYKTFLEMWADADEDLPARMEARARYAALQASGSM
ncbi:MAG: tetratricopeptide repeat protein, partial [Candidatus Krumholzibacteriota bacterium]|nr:tetratricopeptide repeat protein [Candidatus Krumholzibacteriota bacterium]